MTADKQTAVASALTPSRALQPVLVAGSGEGHWEEEEGEVPWYIFGAWTRRNRSWQIALSGGESIGLAFKIQGTSLIYQQQYRMQGQVSGKDSEVSSCHTRSNSKVFLGGGATKHIQAIKLACYYRSRFINKIQASWRPNLCSFFGCELWFHLPERLSYTSSLEWLTIE